MHYPQVLTLNNQLNMKSFYFIIAVLLISSCAPSHFVKPLAKKEKQVNLALGGPVISNLGFPMPIPFISATYGQGLDSATTVYGGVNLTSAAFGNFQTQLGLNRALTFCKGKTPGFSVSPSINLIVRDSKTIAFYPQLDLNAWWDFGVSKQHYIYAGINNWFELKTIRAHEQPQSTNLIFSPQLGVLFSKGTWRFNMETKMIGPNLSNKDIVVDYVSPLSRTGALGFYFGVSKSFK